MLWARSASGEYPVYVGARRARRAIRPARPRASSSPTPPSARSTPTRWGRSRRRIEIPPGEAAKTLGAGRARPARRWRRPGWRDDDHVVALGGGVVGDLAGFCAADLPARRARRAAADDARRAGRLGLRRQDRRRPARGQELRGRLPPAGGGARRPGRARDAAAGGARGRLGRGDQDRADRRRAAVGAGAATRAPTVDADLVLACARTKLAVVAADERDAGRRQVLNLGHTVGHAIETATGYARYRHGEAVALGLLAALTLSGQAGAAGRGRRAAGRARAADDARSRGRPRRGARRRCRATRSGARAGSGSCSSSAPGDVRTGRAVEPADVAAHWRSWRMRNRVAVHARRQPRRARPPAGRALRRADLRQARVRRSSSSRASSSSRRASSRPITRASSSRSCTTRPTTPTGCCSTRAPGRTTRGRCATRSSCRACPRSRSISPTSSTASRSAPSRCSRTSAWRRSAARASRATATALERLKAAL